MMFLTAAAHTEPAQGPITHIYLLYNAAGDAESFEHST